MVRDYWPRFWRGTLFVVIAVQLVVILGIFVGLLYINSIDPTDQRFWLLGGAVLLGALISNSIIAVVATAPLKQLSIALTHAAGEQTSFKAPNPNTPHYQRSGLSSLLKTIYGAESRSLVAKKKPQATPTDSPILHAIFDTSTTGVVVYDSQRKILFHNPSAPVKQVGDDTHELDLEFYTDESFNEWWNTCSENSVRASKTWQHIPNKPTSEPDRRVFDLVASYDKASATPMVLFLVDRTSEYAPEDDDLNFIAFAAHELRGPITVIRGYLDTLVDELSDKITLEERELFERLIVSSNRLSSYINNILNASRYDRRHLSMHLQEIRLTDIYHMIADDMQLRATSQNRLLSVDIPATLPTVAADPTSISEVISNLIDNAIKYSHEGGSVEVHAEAEGNNVRVRVVDHGVGMPANVVSNLFHKFYRSHRSRETVSGTGIGLYISKAIIESHGGEMSATSVDGKGSVFTFMIPTYASVADKLQQSGGSNKDIIQHRNGGWIRNHGAIRG